MYVRVVQSVVFRRTRNTWRFVHFCAEFKPYLKNCSRVNCTDFAAVPKIRSDDTQPGKAQRR